MSLLDRLRLFVERGSDPDARVGEKLLRFGQASFLLGEGLEVGATCAAAVSGAFALAESGEFGPDDTVVLLNTGAGNKDVDALRAHLGEREAAADAAE